MLHDFHATRHRCADAIQRHARQRAQENGQGRNHFRLQTQTGAKKSERSNDNDRGNNGLRDPKHDGKSKQHPAARAIAHGFRARDKCNDRVVETENADLAENVSSRPGN